MILLALALAASPQLDRCLDSGAAARGNNQAMAACFAADHKRADDRLNRAYRAALRRLPASRRAALRTSERAWIRQRDATCARTLGPDKGLIQRVNYPACLTRETDRRTAWLARQR